MKKLVFGVFVLVGMLAACTVLPPTQKAPTLTTGEGVIPTRSSEIKSVLTQSPSVEITSSPTRTVEPPFPSDTFSPVPELLPCPDSGQEETIFPQSAEILYVNDDQLWLWDEVNQEKTRVNLPPEAVAPHISADGRFAAYLVEGQAYDSPGDPLDEIPLWLFDMQREQTRQVASFPISETRRQNPESPHIYLKMRWLESNLEQLEEHWLLVEVYREPWAEGGCCRPGGDLFLVKAETGEFERILEAGSYNFYSLQPDGGQIAALDMDGQLYLIDIPPAEEVKPLSIQLPSNPWLVFAPVYSPDGDHMALQVESGLAVVDADNQNIQQLELENPCEDCYWGRWLPVIWGPDGSKFYTTTTLNDNFDRRSESTLFQVPLGTELKTEPVVVIRASPFTFQFSPDFRYLTYWNQPEFDDIDAGKAEMNWVSLHLMDLIDLQSILYSEEFGLRVNSWSPDNQRFLYTFSSIGGPNLDRRMFSLGNVCQPAQQLPVPAGSIIDESQWLDANRFLAWTLPAEGIPDRYTSGLYLYKLDAADSPIHIDDILVVQTEPYGSPRQVVVLNYR